MSPGASRARESDEKRRQVKRTASEAKLRRGRLITTESSLSKEVVKEESEDDELGGCKYNFCNSRSASPWRFLVLPLVEHKLIMSRWVLRRRHASPSPAG